MEKIAIDIKKLISPIEGNNPSGEELRYTGVYEEIKEARRADDTLNQGDWQRDLKTSDWERVISLGIEALSNKTKDIQIAVWLTEALINKAGFSGLADGLTVIAAYVTDYWDTFYPMIEDGDLEFRAGPLMFLNDKISPSIRDIPLTDSSSTEGYSWHRWQESRQVGFDKDLKNQFGDIDDNKKRARDEKIAEGKITGEQFDAASARSSKQFYAALSEEIERCRTLFGKLDAAVDEKFGRDAPRLSELGAAIDENHQLVSRLLKEKGGADPVQKKGAENVAAKQPKKQEKPEKASAKAPLEEKSVQTDQTVMPVILAADSGGSDTMENAVWELALETLNSSGIKEALQKLLDASASAPSIRQKNRYKLFMAKLSLRAERPDLARPIIEQLYALIDELGLERWESSMWIAEVIDAYYQCLTAEGARDEDISKARNELFPKLCTRDITKAISYKEQINSGG